MYISKIQPTTNCNTNYVRKISNTIPPQVPVDKTADVSFKGNGDGMVGGLGAGLAAGLLVVGGTAIAGILTLPAIIGGAVVLAAGAAGAYVGDKVEDKVTAMKEKRNSDSDKA